MNTVKKYVDQILLLLTSVLFLVMVAITSWQVIARYVFENPSAFTEEFLRFGLIWLSMLAAAYVVGRRAHISFTIISDKLRGSKKFTLDLFIQGIFLVFALVIMIYGGGKAVSLTMAQISPSLGMPMGLVYLSLPVSGVLITFYSILNINNIIKSKYDRNIQFKDEVEMNKAGETI